MEIRCFCPKCGQEFTMDVKEPERPRQKRSVPRQKKAFSEEERARRAERMRALRAQGIGGRPKGVKEKAHRSTYGVPRKKAPEDG